MSTAGRLGRRLLGLSVCVALAACSGTGSAPFRPAEHHAIGQVVVDQASAATWLNAYRREHGLPMLDRDPGLQRVAQGQADAMAAANELSHTVAGTLPERLAVLDRAKRASAENVSAGYADLAGALTGWRRSPRHNDNLLYAPMRRFGMAAARAPGTRYGTFWSLVMTD